MIALLRQLIKGAMKQSLSEREAEVRAQLAPHLNEYDRLIALVYDYISRAAQSYAGSPTQTPVANLQSLLLARLQADLRVCSRAACDGYAFQALSVAASIHEVAYGLIYLGDSQERARAWVDHTNAKTQYPESGHRSAIESAARFFPLTARELEQEYDIYRQLCWAKHGNPLLQREFGAIVSGDTVEVQQQPYFSDNTVKYGRYALLHSSRAVGAALVVFTQLHLGAVVDSHLVAHLAAIGPELNRLGVRDGLMVAQI